MKIEKVSIKNFRCFGPRGTKIKLESGVTAFVGGNGSGKTAVFQALSRLFGLRLRSAPYAAGLLTCLPTSRSFSRGRPCRSRCSSRFRRWEGLDEDAAEDAVPEFFLQMAASAPGARSRQG